MSFPSASCCDVHPITVMPAHSASEDARKRAYVAGIYVFSSKIKTWMAGTSPAMTQEG